MSGREGGPSRQASWFDAYYRQLGETAGKALQPMLRSLAGRATASEWEEVRHGRPPDSSVAHPAKGRRLNPLAAVHQIVP